LPSRTADSGKVRLGAQTPSLPARTADGGKVRLGAQTTEHARRGRPTVARYASVRRTTEPAGAHGRQRQGAPRRAEPELAAQNSAHSAAAVRSG
jgi:hypothetical protein